MILRMLLVGLVLAQVADPATPPDPRPGWRWTAEGVWLNDWTEEKFPVAVQFSGPWLGRQRQSRLDHAAVVARCGSGGKPRRGGVCWRA